MKHLHLQKWIQSWLNDSKARASPIAQAGALPKIRFDGQ
jgi:hypothetical protein